MTNLHYIADESLGGIEREYVEVDRKADVGDYVVHESSGIYGIFERTDGIFAFVNYDGSYNGRDAWYLSKTVTVEPTDIVRIDNARYRLVDRHAEVGEKVIYMYKGKSDGVVTEVLGLGVGMIDVDYLDEEDGSQIFGINHGSYRVLEPVEAEPIDPLTVDETQASPQVIDMFAHIAKELAKINRRLDKAEEHIGDMQRNVETFAQQTEINTEAIRKLASASDIESDRVRKIDFDKDMLMRDIGSLNKRLEAFINDAR